MAQVFRGRLHNLSLRVPTPPKPSKLTFSSKYQEKPKSNFSKTIIIHWKSHREDTMYQLTTSIMTHKFALVRLVHLFINQLKSSPLRFQLEHYSKVEPLATTIIQLYNFIQNFNTINSTISSSDLLKQFSNFILETLPKYTFYMTQFPDVLQHVCSWQTTIWSEIFQEKTPSAQENCSNNDTNTTDSTDTNDTTAINSTHPNKSTDSTNIPPLPDLLTPTDFQIVASMSPLKSLAWFYELLEHPIAFLSTFIQCFRSLRPQSLQQANNNQSEWNLWNTLAKQLDTTFSLLSKTKRTLFYMNRLRFLQSRMIGLFPGFVSPNRWYVYDSPLMTFSGMRHGFLFSDILIICVKLPALLPSYSSDSMSSYNKIIQGAAGVSQEHVLTDELEAEQNLNHQDLFSEFQISKEFKYLVQAVIPLRQTMVRVPLPKVHESMGYLFKLKLDPKLVAKLTNQFLGNSQLHIPFSTNPSSAIYSQQTGLDGLLASCITSNLKSVNDWDLTWCVIQGNTLFEYPQATETQKPLDGSRFLQNILVRPMAIDPDISQLFPLLDDIPRDHLYVKNSEKINLLQAITAMKPQDQLPRCQYLFALYDTTATTQESKRGIFRRRSGKSKKKGSNVPQYSSSSFSSTNGSTLQRYSQENPISIYCCDSFQTLMKWISSIHQSSGFSSPIDHEGPILIPLDTSDSNNLLPLQIKCIETETFSDNIPEPDTLLEIDRGNPKTAVFPGLKSESKKGIQNNRQLWIMHYARVKESKIFLYSSPSSQCAYTSIPLNKNTRIQNVLPYLLSKSQWKVTNKSQHFIRGSLQIFPFQVDPDLDSENLDGSSTSAANSSRFRKKTSKSNHSWVFAVPNEEDRQTWLAILRSNRIEDKKKSSRDSLALRRIYTKGGSGAAITGILSWWIRGQLAWDPKKPEETFCESFDKPWSPSVSLSDSSGSIILPVHLGSNTNQESEEVSTRSSQYQIHLVSPSIPTRSSNTSNIVSNHSNNFSLISDKASIRHLFVLFMHAPTAHEPQCGYIETNSKKSIFGGKRFIFGASSWEMHQEWVAHIFSCLMKLYTSDIRQFTSTKSFPPKARLPDVNKYIDSPHEYIKALRDSAFERNLPLGLLQIKLQMIQEGVVDFQSLEQLSQHIPDPYRDPSEPSSVLGQSLEHSVTKSLKNVVSFTKRRTFSSRNMEAFELEESNSRSRIGSLGSFTGVAVIKDIEEDIDIDQPKSKRTSMMSNKPYHIPSSVSDVEPEVFGAEPAESAESDESDEAAQGVDSVAKTPTAVPLATPPRTLSQPSSNTVSSLETNPKTAKHLINQTQISLNPTSPLAIPSPTISTKSVKKTDSMIQKLIYSAAMEEGEKFQEPENSQGFFSDDSGEDSEPENISEQLCQDSEQQQQQQQVKSHSEIISLNSSDSQESIDNPAHNNHAAHLRSTIDPNDSFNRISDDSLHLPQKSLIKLAMSATLEDISSTSSTPSNSETISISNDSINSLPSSSRKQFFSQHTKLFNTISPEEYTSGAAFSETSSRALRRRSWFDIHKTGINWQVSSSNSSKIKSVSFYSPLSKDPIRCLYEFITSSTWTFCDALCRIPPYELDQGDKVATCLLKVFNATLDAPKLMNHVLSAVVDSTSDPKTILRTSTFSTKLMTQYCEMFGLKFLKFALQPHIQVIVQNPQLFQIDPNRIKAQSSASRVSNSNLNANEPQPSRFVSNSSAEILLQNVHALISMINTLFQSVVGHKEDIPPEIRTICAHLHSLIQRKFPDFARVAVSALFWLRYVCPAIVSPDSWGMLGLAPNSTAASRALVTCSKALMALANEKTFIQADNYMSVVNPWITSKLDQLRDFTSFLSLPLDGESESRSGTSTSSNTSTLKHISDSEEDDELETFYINEEISISGDSFNASTLQALRDFRPLLVSNISVLGKYWDSIASSSDTAPLVNPLDTFKNNKSESFLYFCQILAGMRNEIS